MSSANKSPTTSLYDMTENRRLDFAGVVDGDIKSDADSVKTKPATPATGDRLGVAEHCADLLESIWTG